MENIQIAAWNENPSAFRAADGDMDVWKIFPNLRNKSDLPETELLRCEAINNPLARQNELSSRIGVRRILGRYMGISPSVLTFEREGRGKPFLAGGLQFNLSHTKDQILLGVGRQPVGLDVESIDREVRAEELASKFFHEEERMAVLGGLHGGEHRTFLKYWVCKEATVKLSGDGIYHGLRDARILCENGRMSGSYRGRVVYLSIFSPGAGFLAAVASWTPLQTLRFFSLGNED